MRTSSFGMSAAVTTNMQRGQLLENETFAGALCFFLRESSGHSGCLLLAPREGWWPRGHQHIVYPGTWPTHCLPGGSANSLFTRGTGALPTTYMEFIFHCWVRISGQESANVLATRFERIFHMAHGAVYAGTELRVYYTSCQATPAVLQLAGSHHPASPPLQTVTWLHILPYVAMVLDTSDSYVVDEVISSGDWSTSAVFFLVS